ncbi:membrane dipeptidase-domain-containing protein, partial [Clohesyomyces aquaticus]
SNSPNGADPNTAVIVHLQQQEPGWSKRWRSALLAATPGALIIPISVAGTWFWPFERAIDPTNFALRMERVLKSVPFIDGHNDFSWLLHVELHNKIYDGSFDPNERLLGYTDITRRQQGKMGGQFRSVHVHCDATQNYFEDRSWVVRDTLEQIDIAKRFWYPGVFTYCETPACARAPYVRGKIESMLEIEGGHQLGGSIAAVRQAYALRIRYITPTHNCGNAWATSASTVAAGVFDKELTVFGHSYVREMNRLGMMIDLSHVSHATMRDVLSITQTLVIFSYSGAYSVTSHLRSVPDDGLRNLHRNGGIVMAVIVNRFLNMEDPSAQYVRLDALVTIHDIADHIWHLAEVVGWEHVGIRSDFKGMPFTPSGFEGVSKYPNLIELVMARGATDEKIHGLVGDNIIRVWGNIQRRGEEIRAEGRKPVEEEREGRVWHRGYKSSPYMYRRTRERAAEEGWGQPNQSSVAGVSTTRLLKRRSTY